MLSDELCGLEIELEAADEIDVQSVEIGEQGLEAEPVPLRDATSELLAPALITLVIEYDTIIRMRHLYWCGIWSSSIEMGDEITRGIREVAADFQDRDEFPFRRKSGVERTERVRDATPLFDRRIARVATVNHVPHETPHDSNSLLPRHSPVDNPRLL